MASSSAFFSSVLCIHFQRDQEDRLSTLPSSSWTANLPTCHVLLRAPGSSLTTTDNLWVCWQTGFSESSLYKCPGKVMKVVWPCVSEGSEIPASWSCLEPAQSPLLLHDLEFPTGRFPDAFTLNLSIMKIYQLHFLIS